MIGRYRVVRRLGEGGFATVYLAEDMRLDALVAVKLLHRRMADDGEIRARFIREAQIMRRLATPGLVAVHDIDEHDGRPFFVMEYCTGGTLADRLDAVGGRIGVDQALALAGALREATAGIHRAGTVHRDLKPTNYLIAQRSDHNGKPVSGLLGADEELVVGDFGLAKAIEVDATKLTVSGGTPGFGAPEQFQGDPTVDARADVYSLSAILASALSGDKPQLVLAPGVMPFTEGALAAAGPLAGELARGMALDRTHRHDDVVTWEAALTAAAATARSGGMAATAGETVAAGGLTTGGATVVAASSQPVARRRRCSPRNRCSTHHPIGTASREPSHNPASVVGPPGRVRGSRPRWPRRHRCVPGPVQPVRGSGLVHDPRTGRGHRG